MAKITAEFDTKEKTLEVKMDGKALGNVQYVSFGPSWKDDEKFYGSIQMAETHDDEDMRTMTSICASLKDDGVELTQAKTEAGAEALRKEISDYFTKTKAK
jgi:hypothetical protein